MKLSKHCARCGWEWTLPKEPAFKEVCQECGEFLHICDNCQYWDGANRHCENQEVDESWEPSKANFCEFFKFAERVTPNRIERRNRPGSAIERWNKLFDD